MKFLILFLSVSICVHLWLTAPAAASGPIEPQAGGLIDLPMYHDPALEPPVTTQAFHPRLSDLWLAALGRPDAELRREAAVAFGRAARDGMEVDGEARAKLVEVLTEDPDAAVRVAAAEALTSLKHVDAAAAMLDVNRTADEVELIYMTDRALADWRHEPAVDVWIGRVIDAAGLDVVRRSAMRALGDVPTRAAFEPLMTVATDADAPLALRLEAGRAAGKLLQASQVTSEAASDAAADLVAGSRNDQRVAAAVLAVTRDSVQGTDSMRATLLGRLLDGDDPTVVAAAIQAVAVVDPSKLQAQFDRFVKSRDASVRLAAVHAIEAVMSEERAAQIQQLTRWLDDPSVRVRHAAREQLVLLGRTPAWSDEMRQAISAGLGSSNWRGLEQAALLAGAIDHEPAADRLIELLRHDRAEVRLAAAAALRQLAVPKTLPAMLERAQQITDSPRESQRDAGRVTTQIFMMFGQMKYVPSDALLRRYIPKNSGFSAQARGAAIYALGKLHEGQADPALVRTLGSRFSDVNPMTPEVTEVRRFAAIALGRMNAQQQLAALRKFLDEENSSVDIGGAARWAIMQITGEELPPLDPLTYEHTGWFLEPAE